MNTTVIYHREDFDGLFCREIARRALPTAKLIGWDYAEQTPVVSLDEDLYILDLSVPGLMEHPRLTWIDHHKSAIDKYPAAILGYRIDGVAACRLAWQWFFRPCADTLPTREQFIDRAVVEPLAVRLAGEYDVWDKRDPSVATFQCGLRSEPLDALWPVLLGADRARADHVITRLMRHGAMIQRYQKEQDASVVKRAFTQQFHGLTFLCLNTARCNSATFESMAGPEHEALMAFCFDGSAYCVSLYHAPRHTEQDLSRIAATYGGGGHRGACGFRTATLPFLPPHAPEGRS